MQRICIARCLLWTGVCPLQVGVPSNRTNGSNCFYGIEAHTGLSYTYVIREFGHLQIHNQYTSLCNKLSQTLNVSIFLLFRTARQPSYMLSTGPSTSFDRRKFNILSAHLLFTTRCPIRKASCGSSAAADTCLRSN